jgi:molecular chaperone DnaK (HSP70)
MRLGIDFGTTRTVVVGIEDGNYPVCTFSWEGETKDHIPSLVAIKGKTLRFGWEAVQWQKEAGVQWLPSLKRLIGQLRPEDPIDLTPDFSVPVLDLVTQFLIHVKKMVVHHSHLAPVRKKPLEAIAAVPANASTNQRYITLEAFRRAGFRVLSLMNEPSAAAVEFVHRYLKNLGSKSPKEYVVVYDLGGGTFDTAVVGFADRTFEVITHEGIARLGGDDFDRIIMDLVLKKIGIPETDLSRDQKMFLLRECQERKEGLKPNTQKMMLDLEPVFGQEESVVLGTKEIYEHSFPLIEQSLSLVDRVIQNLRMRGIDVESSHNFAALYLVGGSVIFPPVSRKLKETYGRKVRVSPFPQAATAIGLAIAADPQVRLNIRETVSRNFGLWREGEGGWNKVFDCIFSKDLRLDPSSEERREIRRYRPVHNVGHLRFLECSRLGPEGEPLGDLVLWPEVLFPYDPALKNQKDLSRVSVVRNPNLALQEVYETYIYTSGGFIQVEIENRTGGYKRAFTFGVRADQTYKQEISADRENRSLKP